MPDYNRNLQSELGAVSDSFISSVKSKIDFSNCNEDTKNLLLDISNDICNSLSEICMIISKYHS